jgi:hypothetical protein
VNNLETRNALFTARRVLAVKQDIVRGDLAGAQQKIDRLAGHAQANFDLVGGERDRVLLEVRLAAGAPPTDSDGETWSRERAATVAASTLEALGLTRFEAWWAAAGYGRPPTEGETLESELHIAFASRSGCLSTLHSARLRCRLPLALATSQLAQRYAQQRENTDAEAALLVFDRMWPTPDADLLPTQLAAKARAALAQAKAAR